jgi:hypothetical protein
MVGVCATFGRRRNFEKEICPFSNETLTKAKGEPFGENRGVRAHEDAKVPDYVSIKVNVG